MVGGEQTEEAPRVEARLEDVTALEMTVKVAEGVLRAVLRVGRVALALRNLSTAEMSHAYHNPSEGNPAAN